MSLPDPLEAEFWIQMRQFEEEQQMPYITSVERLGMQRGREEGRQEGEAKPVLRQLNRRLGQVSATIEAAQIRLLPVEQLEDLGETLLDFETEAELLNWLAK